MKSGKLLFIVLFLFSLSPSFAQSQKHEDLTNFLKPQVDDDSKFTSTGNIGITITNYGRFGDGFVQQSPVDQPSCVYPKGSGIEHLFVGGLWVGANTASGTYVTTGAFNTPRLGSGASANFEFTNTANPSDRVTERSSLEEDKYFSPLAISHQDFIADFTDTNTYVPGTSIPIPYHHPLGLGVHLETYAWNYPFADAFVIFNYTIKNVWPDTLKDVYVGLWADLVVRNTNITPPRVGSPFYLHAGVGYVDNDSMKMVYCYDYDGDPGFTNSYVSMTLLGADPVAGDKLYQGKTTHNWWLFSGGDADEDRPPADEASRYARMTNSITDTYYRASIYETPGNRMSLLSTGPFEKIPPDSSINVVFAMVCAKKAGFNSSKVDDEAAKKNLIDNNSWAYRAYYGEDTNRNGVLDYAGTDSTEDVNGNGKLDRYVLPTPPSPPKLKVVPGNGRVDLYWDSSSLESIDLISKKKDFEGFRVYRSFLGNDLTAVDGVFSQMGLIGEFDKKDGLFYDTGLDSIRLPQPITEITKNPTTGLPDTVVYTFKMEIDNLHNGWQYAFSVAAFDSGDVNLNLPSLESSRLQNATLVSLGTPARKADDTQEVGVYPNPYRARALWDGSLERERKLYFYNLPNNCEVRIYTLAGDVVDHFTHHGDSYNGQGIRWYDKYGSGNTIFPGGEHAWDLVSSNDQAIATGLYLFTVKDLDNGNIYKGKFVVIK